MDKSFSTQRKSNRRRRSSAQALGFESLEHRRVLATGVFDAATATLAVDVPADEIQTIFDNDGQFVTLAGSTDLDDTQEGLQQVRVEDVRNIAVTGTQGAVQSVVLRGTFDELNSLSIENLSHVLFDGTWQLQSDLTINQTPNDLQVTGQVADTANSVLTVNGNTSISIQSGSLDFLDGVTNLNGQFDFSDRTADGDHRLQAAGDLVLGQIDAGTLRLEANSIADINDSSISIARAYLRADSIELGETGEDFVDIQRLNFKSDGSVDITDDRNLELIGASNANNLNLVVTDWLSDARFARTNVNQLASFTAEQISLGDGVDDEFLVGLLNFHVTTHASFSADQSIELTGNIVADTFDLTSTQDIRNAASSTLDITYHTHFEAEGDISIGMNTDDFFVTQTLSFAAPDGHVEFSEDDHIHVLHSGNVANSLYLQTDGNITDDIESETAVTNVAQLAASSIFLGEGFFGEFEAGAFEFTADNRVFIEHKATLTLTGEVSAEAISLYSQDLITNTENANIDIAERAQFKADSITLGRANGDSFTTGWITFDADDSVTISEDGDLLIAGENNAQEFQLQSTGRLSDTENSTTNATGHAHLRGNSITFGTDSQFTSGTLQAESVEDVVIHQQDDIVLAGQSRARSIRLNATGSIENVDNATLVSNSILDLVAESITLGDGQGDHFETTTLTFQTTNDSRIQVDDDVSLTGDNFAKSFELMAEGNIRDTENTTVQAEFLARLSGFDVVLGDSEGDCFMVESNTIVVEASGVESLTTSICTNIVTFP